MLPLCRLPDAIQKGLIDGSLALPTVWMLSRHPDDTAVLLAEFLRLLKLSLQKQKEVIELISEISIRDDISIHSVLQSDDIVRIMNDPEMDMPRKTGLIRGHLKKWRYPKLSEAEDSFRALRSELKLGGDIAIRPPAGFEGTRYALSISFQSISELEDHQQAIEIIKNNRQLQRLLNERGSRTNKS
jgi:hypothetical protein